MKRRHFAFLFAMSVAGWLALDSAGEGMADSVPAIPRSAAVTESITAEASPPTPGSDS